MNASDMLRMHGLDEGERVFIRQDRESIHDSVLERQVWPARMHRLREEGVAFGPGMPVFMIAKAEFCEATIVAYADNHLLGQAEFYLQEQDAFAIAYGRS